MGGRVRWSVAIATSLAAACSLFPDLGGLTGDDASVTDAKADVPLKFDSGPDAPNGCPWSTGPSMVRVTDSYGSFCIDSTEVTNAQYQAMLAPPPFPPECAWKTATTKVAENDDLPVTMVDWCDAYVFCQWSGKRMCGSRNGTPIDDFGPANDPQVAEWYAACSRSGSRAYPYGSTYAVGTCNGCDRAGSCAMGVPSPAVPVGSLPECVGGYDGIFDLSGNVAEWTVDCDDSGAPHDNGCPPLGGSRRGDAGDITCTVTTDNLYDIARSAVAEDVGFRCCANAN
jgi:formylglycine-generating enzyme required for sulfatase activity